jgi:hypothetical protein
VTEEGDLGEAPVKCAWMEETKSASQQDADGSSKTAPICFELRRASDASESSLLRGPAEWAFLHRIAIPPGNPVPNQEITMPHCPVPLLKRCANARMEAGWVPQTKVGLGVPTDGLPP